MKLLYMLGQGGVEYWRCRTPGMAMKKHGLAEVEVIEKNWATSEEIGNKLAWCDGLIVASPMGVNSLAAFKKYQSMGKKVFLDYDDYTYDVSPLNPAYKVLGVEEAYVEDRVTGEKTALWQDKVAGFDIRRNYINLRSLKDILDTADAITTTTLYLKDKWQQHVNDPEKVHVLPNAVDFTRWKPCPEARSWYKDDFRIGYICSAAHSEDWMKIAPALHYFLDKHPGAKLVVMGDTGFDLKGRFKEGQLEWKSWSSIYDAHYQMQVATLGLDVAIMPLEINEFNKCKSPLKYVEMTAFGYPVIAQRCLPYTEDIRSGENGLLAGSTEEWLAALTAVYNNKDLRSKLHFNALLTCKEWYDIDKVCHDWAAVYRKALGLEQVILK